MTTLELAACVDPLPVIGVDISPAVIENAQRFEAPNVTFVQGSFTLPVRGARLIRVMNVLRDGPPEAVAGAHAEMGASLLDGGLLIEGSCAPSGEVGAVHWVRKRPAGLVREGLVMWLDGVRGMHPMAFRDRLPRDLRGDRRHPVYGVLARWADALGQLPRSPERLTQAAASIAGLTPIPIAGGLAYKLVWASG